MKIRKTIAAVAASLFVAANAYAQISLGNIGQICPGALALCQPLVVNSCGAGAMIFNVPCNAVLFTMGTP